MEDNVNVEGHETELGEQAECESWDDITFDDLADEEEESAEDTGNNENADSEEESKDSKAENEDIADDAKDSKTEDVAEKKEEGHQLYTLKHLKEEKQYPIEEVLKLASKGQDYDHVKQERDSMKAHDAFLKEMADKAGLSVEEYADKTRAMWLMSDTSKTGKPLSEGEAILQVQRNRNAQPKGEKEEEHEDNSGSQVQDREAERKVSLGKFVEEYPDVKAEEIPQTVWQDFISGKGELSALYAKHQNKQLKAEIETLKQNNKNKQRSTGSLVSAGNAIDNDTFDSLWDADD